MIIFDLDGPVLDVSEKYCRVYSDLVMELGGRPLDKKDYWMSKRDGVSDETILNASGIGKSADDYVNRWKARIESPKYLSYDRVWPGMLELLRDLRSRNILVLVTLRHNKETLHGELHALGILALFHHVLSAPGSGTIEERSSAKTALVNTVCPSMNPHDWFVGDTESDVLAGRLLGVQTVAVTFGLRTEKQLQRTSPDVLIHNPQHLIEWAQRRRLALR